MSSWRIAFGDLVRSRGWETSCLNTEVWYQRNFSQKLANGTIRPSKNEGLEDCICFKLGVVSNVFLRKTKVWCWVQVCRVEVGYGRGERKQKEHVVFLSCQRHLKKNPGGELPPPAQRGSRPPMTIKKKCCVLKPLTWFCYVCLFLLKKHVFYPILFNMGLVRSRA